MNASEPRPPEVSRPGQDAPARDLETVLRQAEHLLQARTRDRLERAVPQAAGAPPARLREVAQELERLTMEDPVAAARAGARLDDVRTRLALHTRDVPDAALVGLYEDVRAATSETDPWARSRMSEAFLDAPRHLVRWRRTAMAACAVLAVGAGLFAGGRLGFESGDAGGVGGADPRDGILERLHIAGPFAGQRSRGPAAGTLVSVPGASEPERKAPSFWVFHVDRRRPSNAGRLLDAVRARVAGPRVEQVEHN